MWWAYIYNGRNSKKWCEQITTGDWMRLRQYIWTFSDRHLPLAHSYVHICGESPTFIISLLLQWWFQRQPGVFAWFLSSGNLATASHLLMSRRCGSGCVHQADFEEGRWSCLAWGSCCKNWCICVCRRNEPFQYIPCQFHRKSADCCKWRGQWGCTGRHVALPASRKPLCLPWCGPKSSGRRHARKQCWLADSHTQRWNSIWSSPLVGNLQQDTTPQA